MNNISMTNKRKNISIQENTYHQLRKLGSFEEKSLSSFDGIISSHQKCINKGEYTLR